MKQATIKELPIKIRQMAQRGLKVCKSNLFVFWLNEKTNTYEVRMVKEKKDDKDVECSMRPL